MPDREKVIKGLCEAIGVIHGHVPKRYWGYGEQACRDAIAMLEEQEEQLNIKTENFNRLIAKIGVLPKIVRCKDCKNAEIIPWLDNVIICKKHNYTGVRPDEFYCADGERE